MGVRQTVSGSLTRVIGPERAGRVRRAEAKARSRLIDVLDVEGQRPKRRRGPAKKKAASTKAASKKPAMTREQLIAAHAEQSPEGLSHSKADSLPFVTPDPFASFPKPSATRHSLLEALHEQLQPRTYVEIGVSTGASLALSRTRSIGVDPAFTITQPIECDVQLVREPSDDFFARPDAFDHLGGVPVDLAFIDGMHLAEYALRDFMNMEKQMSPAGVIVLDDMLPRNALEAYRIRRTSAWTGDVYKVHDILARYRPDLTLVPVHTRPTGSYLVLGLDPTSTVLDDHLAEIEAELITSDPQTVPQDWLERRTAVDPQDLLGLDVWSTLAAAQEGEPDRAELDTLWKQVAALPVIAR